MKMLLQQYCEQLKKEERSENTIKKYRRDIQKYIDFLEMKNLEFAKASVIDFKKNLLVKYRVTSANSIIIAVNNFLKFINKEEYCVKIYKLQKQTYIRNERSFELHDYKKLIQHPDCRKDDRALQMLYTFAETGIRVSELQNITVDALENGQAVINNKGKVRVILLTNSLINRLKKYCKRKRIESGAIFITKSGKAVDRFYIWRLMKRMAYNSNILKSKVFPHNFRHLFARQFYRKQFDIVRLADFLGHTSIETTRIYISTGNLDECRLQLENLFQ